MSEVSGGGIDGAYNALQQAVDKQEGAMAKAEEASQSGDKQDIMALQIATQKWMLMSEMQSNVIRAVSETLRSMVKNIN